MKKMVKGVLGVLMVLALMVTAMPAIPAQAVPIVQYDLDVDGTYDYTPGQPAIGIAAGLTVTSDPAGATLDNAIVIISSGFQAGSDTLAATDSGGVTSSYDAAKGILTLSGSADVSAYQTVLGSVTFSTDSADTTARTVSYTLGKALPYSNGHFFEYVSSSMATWADSNTAASSRIYFGRGGYLATLTDAGENNFAATKIGGAGAWVGGSDAEAEDTWKWVSGPEAGTVMAYTNWNAGEPNNTNGDGRPENYLQFLAGGSGKWNDLDGTGNSSVQGYVVEYGGLGSDAPMDIEGSVTVNITANSAPVAVEDAYNATMTTQLDGSTVLGNDTDADSDPLTAVLVTEPGHDAAFTFNADGTFSYTPENGFQGLDTFTYKANDGTEDSNEATVNITVSPNLSTYVSNANLDGWVRESSETSSKGGYVFTDMFLRVGDNKQNMQYRSVVSFPTLALPDGAVILKASLKMLKYTQVSGTDPFTTHGNLWADIQKGSFGLPALQVTDFEAPASKPGVGVFKPVAGEPGWYQMVLGKANYQYINWGGVTQFRLRFALDDNNNGVEDMLRFFGGESTIAKYRPVLLVEYYVPLP